LAAVEQRRRRAARPWRRGAAPDCGEDHICAVNLTRLIPMSVPARAERQVMREMDEMEQEAAAEDAGGSHDGADEDGSGSGSSDGDDGSEPAEREGGGGAGGEGGSGGGGQGGSGGGGEGEEQPRRRQRRRREGGAGRRRRAFQENVGPWRGWHADAKRTVAEAMAAVAAKYPGVAMAACLSPFATISTSLKDSCVKAARRAAVTLSPKP